jgi:hypothetical protein
MTLPSAAATLRDVSNAHASSAWLTHEMARALAAAYPPLNSTDVVSAADELANHTSCVPAISHLLRRGSNLISARGVVEALGALRDLRD